MLIYVFLALICLSVAVLIIWALRGLSGHPEGVGSFSSARHASRARMAHINASISDAPSPWGWSPNRSNRAVAQTYAAGKGAHHATLTSVRKGGVVPGARGDSTEKRLERNVLTGYDLTKARAKPTETDTTSWPYRDDSFYRPGASGNKRPADLTRSGLDRRDRDLDERPGSDGKKPWGW